MAEVRLDNVWKVFDSRVEAVRQVDAFVPDGSFCVLVGPSGCGKSTTLRMIAGLEEISEGTVSIGGRVVNDIAPKDRDIAMVFQNYALYPHMTVERNLSFALHLRGMKKDEIRARVGEAAEQLGLTGLLKRKPGALSGGQRQRVALGRALVREPAVFLFDEPLSNLDAKLRGRTRADLKALHRRLKATMIYVTHDQEEAMSLGDMIVVMADGEVQQTGAPLDVFDRPANRFVAGFIGTPPMNFLDGTIEPDGEAIGFTETGAADGDARPVRLRVPGGEGPAEAGPAALGIRPQAVSAAAEGAGGEGLRFTIRVDMVEPLGEQIDVHARTPAGSPVVFRLPARTEVSAGRDLELKADAGRLRLFEPGEFGAALGPRGTTPHATSTAPAAGAATDSIGDEHG